MSILGDLQKQNGGAWVDLFILDCTALGGGITRFHAGTNGFKSSVIWQEEIYQPFPMQMIGFEWDGGKPVRPKIIIANTTGVMSALVRDYDDLVGAKVIRKRTQVKYLDSVNFPNAINPSHDPMAHMPDELFMVVQKTREDKFSIEFEIGTPMDLQGVMLPRRQIISNRCMWQYRGEGCGYAGGAVAKEDDTPTSNIALDACSKRVSGCKLRFGANNQLPFGGFQAASLIRY
jgi:lambda family phage minor tail protein L